MNPTEPADSEPQGRVPKPLPAAWPELDPSDLELRALRWRAAAVGLRLEREGDGWALLLRMGGVWVRALRNAADLAAVDQAISQGEATFREYWRRRSANLMQVARARQVKPASVQQQVRRP